ncbi:sulfatase-like hydrolase/transferase [Rubritalea tangerina]|uniref:Sulfatase-like hydrolase/transferase n=1 Tax=Rubritalea tangerina TaxID=430798 RepID=A0ABW4ZEL5_9BACT
MKAHLSLILVWLLSLTTNHAAQKPNILFILTDDHAYNTLGSYGNNVVKTPVMDTLAQQGTRFTHAYNSGAWRSGMCLPSRTMMMTGLQLWDAADTASSKDLRENFISKQLFFPQLMNQAGYETYFSGKWHIGNNDSSLVHDSFDNVINIRPNMPSAKGSYNRPKPGKPDPWDPTDPKFGGFYKGGKHWSEVLADDGITFIKQASKKKRPFMIYLCFNAPHDPRQSPQQYQDLYKLEDIQVPQPFYPQNPHLETMGLKGMRDEKTAPMPRSEYALRVNRKEYYALISHTDAQIGRVLNALDAHGLASNTLVVLTSDHGLACGHHGLMGKQNMYEHSLRAPWIIKGPNIPSGKTFDTPIYLQSAMTTILDAAGAPIPKHVAFESVLPIINNPKLQKDKPIYGAFLNKQRMVKTKNFKLIWYPKDDIELLFDLQKDPKEITNLSQNPQYASQLDAMRQLLNQQMQSMKDPLVTNKPLPNK